MSENYEERKIGFLQKKILKWFNLRGRKFYWRKKGLSDYEYVIAEVLLQRTKAETVAKFYPMFIENFPNWHSLANVDLDELGEFLKPLGLFVQRSSRLRKLAQEMVIRKGKLPIDRSELEAIPFMGQYIANAVELMIFDLPSPLIDVNMARVLERFFGKRKMADIRYDPYLQSLSYKVVNHQRAKDVNWAILDYAASVCKAAKPLCTVCELRVKCLYFNKLND